MNDFILDADAIDAMLFAFAVGLAYTEQEMQSGELTAEQYADFEATLAKLNELSEQFSSMTDEQGETVH